MLDEARRHGLAPLLHRHLPALTPPEWARDRLEREFATGARRSLALAAELLDVMAALKAAGVSAMPYKGPALAAAVYGSVALRHSLDLDILVHRADVAAADSVLRRQDYRPVPALTAAAERAQLRSGCERRYVRGSMTVELHWAIAPRYFGAEVGLAGLWVRRRRVAIGGTSLPAPGPEDQLLLLTVHGGKHVWERIGWMADVAELMRAHPTLDYAAVRLEARRRGVERLLRLGLGLAHALLDAPLPRDVAGWVRRDHRLDGLIRHVCQRRLAPRAAAPGFRETTRFHLASRERWGDRLRYATRLALTPTEGDGMAVALPLRLGWAYRIVRPGRLAAKYGRRLAARIAGRLRRGGWRPTDVIPAFPRR